MRKIYLIEIYVSLGSWDIEQAYVLTAIRIQHAKDRHGYNNEMEMKRTLKVVACTFCIAYQIGGFVWIFSFYSHFDIVIHKKKKIKTNTKYPKQSNGLFLTLSLFLYLSRSRSLSLSLHLFIVFRLSFSIVRLAPCPLFIYYEWMLIFLCMNAWCLFR